MALARVEGSNGAGWLLTDALETGSCPLGNVVDFIAQALSQAGRTSFTLETRVTNIPLPGILLVTLDMDVCVFNRFGSRTCGTCKSANKRREMNTFQLVQKPPRSLALRANHPA